jgi:hypothetical protein
VAQGVGNGQKSAGEAATGRVRAAPAKPGREGSCFNAPLLIVARAFKVVSALLVHLG